ncbi:MAG: DUF1800 family protein [Thermoanaerobaculia bacterium]
MRRQGATLAILATLWIPAAAAASAAPALEAKAKGAAAAPAFSPPPGSHAAPLAVTLTTATSGATIYYTTDGSSPSRQKSPIYKGPVQLTAKTTVKAFAYKKGLRPSAVTTGTYTLTAPPPPPSEQGGTLFLAALTPQGSATSTGSGSSTLTLTKDQSAAILRFSYSGLSGPLTSQHIHAADGTILFDVDTAKPQADGSRVWRIGPAGAFDTAAVLAALRGGECYLNLHTAAYPAGEIKGYFRPSSGSQTFTPPPAPPALPPGPPALEDAARFLLQATYGPRPGEAEALQLRGFTSWLDEQLALPTASHLAAYDELVAQGEEAEPGLVRESFFEQAVQGPDQLRQRMVFALSELFVISDRDAELRNNPASMAAYLDLLARNAFGGFRELLEAVTLSPAMGFYLDMAGSSRAIPEQGLNPNENYPREILQLFSIGLYELHPDGTLHLDAANQPIPTYDQEVVKGLARAFTGWTLGGQDQSVPRRFFRPQRNFRIPMEPWEAFHSTDEKRLFPGVVLPAGQGARTDLEQALDAVFLHPNVGPFVCRFLIQRLVTSNPSPAYIYRCGQKFADNGAGVRGDLKAVLKAILLDYEARSATIAARQDAGHPREPAVRLAGLLRTLDAEPRNGRWRFFSRLDREGLSTGQTPLRAPTVFNFFEPGYALPGEIARAGLVSPEFQIATETTILGSANLILTVLGGAGRNGPVRVDLAPFLPPQAPNDEALLDRIDVLLFGGSMSDATRGILRIALADPGFPRTGDQRVLTLLWLASLAPESVVQK